MGKRKSGQDRPRPVCFAGQQNFHRCSSLFAAKFLPTPVRLHLPPAILLYFCIGATHHENLHYTIEQTERIYID